MLIVVKLIIVMLIQIKLSLSTYYAECRRAECRFAGSQN
jgi:hypothetical protein